MLDETPLPPVPSFPDAVMNDGEPQQSSFEIYDTCDSKPKMKNGDGPLTASKAKEVWLEREVRSLKVALDRVAVPHMVQQSGYWYSGFDSRDLSKPVGLSVVVRIDLMIGPSMVETVILLWAQHGGCGVNDLQDRASAPAATFMDAIGLRIRVHLGQAQLLLRMVITLNI